MCKQKNGPDMRSRSNSNVRHKKPLFPLGQTSVTRGVLAHFEKYGIDAQEYLERHVRGDWGDICTGDQAQNVYAVSEGFRIFSVYTTAAGRRIWIITEADRSATTILFPEEY